MNKIYLLLTLFIFASINLSAQTPSLTPKQISGGVLNGKATSLPVPEYPAAAKAVRASGAVNVQVLIDEQGAVVSANAVSGHPLLRQTAEKAALKASFSPTTLSGQPVKVSGIIVYNFVPEKDDSPVWALGMFFTFVENADQNLMETFGDEAEFDLILSDMAKDIPTEFAAEKPLFDKLANSEGAERQEPASILLSSLNKHFNQSELWEVETGKYLALVLIEMLKQKINADNELPMNDLLLKSHLEKIKLQISIAPSDISRSKIEKFEAVAIFADNKDLTSLETLEQMLEVIGPLFDSIGD